MAKSLSRAVDLAIAAENRRAIADGAAPEVYERPIYPPGTPEYEAYRAQLREALAAWSASALPKD